MIVAQRDHTQRAQSACLTISAEHKESTLPPPYNGFGATSHHITAIPDTHCCALNAVRDAHQHELNHMRDAHHHQLTNISTEHQHYFFDIVHEQEHNIATRKDTHRRELVDIAKAHKPDTAKCDKVERLCEGLMQVYRWVHQQWH
ncbi:hypothetical protein K488DRAFT_91433 [Vararia minispora EC-137]|uniref:Uncharacterized protein n=1 Tax=Vararia minispora EC-137 TaxID=1314806 RepID=A0ACB8Q5L5_9AGAM|nr:hypothetical protein K488DRAFT_91433 [Vararia minispora EC-137]